MKVIKEERIFLKKDLTIAFKEVSCLGSKIFIGKKTTNLDKKTILLDDFIILEPAKNFPGGKAQEYIANRSDKQTVKYIVVKAKYLDTFDQALSHYLKLTEQKHKSSLVSQFILLRNNVFLVKVGRCSMKNFPTKLSLHIKEIKAQLDAMYGRVDDPNVSKVIVRGKVKEIKRIL